MILNNQKRVVKILDLLRKIQVESNDAWEELVNDNEMEFVNLITDIHYCVDCIKVEVLEASKEEYHECFKQMLEEERENGDE